MHNVFNEDLLVAWRAIPSNKDSDSLCSISLNNIDGFKIRAGRINPDGCESLLISFKSVVIPHKKYLPQGRGFDVDSILLDDISWLIISRKSEGDLDLFSKMLEDIFKSVKMNRSLAYLNVFRLVIARITSWQDFMEKGCGGLSREAELGLVGELYVLSELLRNNILPEIALAGWKGPEGGAQDFELGNGCIEVKSTLATEGFSAKINSIEQLDDYRRQPLFLSGLYYSLSSNGESLPTMVEYFRNRFVKSEKLIVSFEGKLSKVGYYDAHSDKYERLFDFLKLKCWLVNEQFPRLIRDNIHSSIYKVNYEVDLGRFSGEVLTLKNVLTKLGV